jgi:hypothetical protein
MKAIISFPNSEKCYTIEGQVLKPHHSEHSGTTIIYDVTTHYERKILGIFPAECIIIFKKNA